MFHSELEIAVVRWMAALGGLSRPVDGLAFLFVDNLLFRAAPSVVLLAGYWNSAGDSARLRATRRIVSAGFLAAGIGLLLSRLAQNIWDSPRPIYDPAFEGVFQPKFLSLIDEDYHSFPSDHAAFILPLVWAVSRLERRLGVLTATLLAGTLLARIYTGVHFPVDLLGGLLLGATAVLFVRLLPDAPDRALALVEAARGRWSVATAAVLFLIAYSYASMFEPVRDLALAILRALWRVCCDAA